VRSRGVTWESYTVFVWGGHRPRPHGKGSGTGSHPGHGQPLYGCGGGTGLRDKGSEPSFGGSRPASILSSSTCRD